MMAHNGSTMVWSIAFLVSIVSINCAVFEKLHYREAEIEEILARETVLLDGKEVPAPFHVTQEQIKFARDVVRGSANDLTKARRLLNAIMDESGLGIQWENFTTLNAAETIEKRRGSCVSIAAVYVGLARAVGLNAYFAEATNVFEESYADDEFVVTSGHLTAVADTSEGRAAFQLGNPFNPIIFVDKISDVAATAHFYNNRGFELIHRARASGYDVDWQAAAKQFELATRLHPEFAQAWNNLGIASARLGLPVRSERCYLRAIAAEPEFSTAYANLGSLYARTGEYRAAARFYEQAVLYDEYNPRKRYYLARMLNRLGETDKAIEELEVALLSSDPYPSVCKMLTRLQKKSGRNTRPECSGEGSIDGFHKYVKTYQFNN